MAPKKEKDLRENVDGNKLDLSMSELVEVPVKSIAAIRKATSLDLSNNNLVTLPKNFCTLTHLVELDLSKNSLQELPERFGDLVLLKRLDLYGNKLTHLPLSFSQLKALKWLDLKNNPLVPKLAEIAGPCGDAQQCQQCARNIVAALLTAALKVEEERKKKLDEQLKEKERIEQELKKEIEADNAQKKANKKGKKGKGDKQSVNESRNAKLLTSTNGKTSGIDWNQAEKQESKQSKQQPTKKNQGLLRWFLSTLFWAAFTASLAFVAAISFALFDRKHFQHTMEQWGTHTNATTDFVLQSAKVVEYAVKHPAVREMRLQLVACFRSIVASMLNIYKTVCQEFPAYYEILKGKFA